MNQKKLLALWAAMFILCAGLGFIQLPVGGLKVFLITVAVAFFIPPALLIRSSVNRKRPYRDMLLLIRNLSLFSLIATTLVLLLNFLSVNWPGFVGDALYGLLVVISTPMICGQYWLISLFLWACLLMVCLKHLRKTK
jgi:hypothetical protein